MSSSIFAVVFLAGVFLYFMTPAERSRLAEWLKRAIQAVLAAIGREKPAADPFEEFLRARTHVPIVTPVLLIANIALYVGLVLEPGVLDKQTLIEWGGNYAPATSNGEWRRWVLSIFLHAGVVHLITTLAGLATMGSILERTVGRIAFGCVFIASGVIASIVSLAISSTTAVTFGASGALFGVYGLLVATLVCGYLRSPRMPISLNMLARVAAGGAICATHAFFTDHLPLAAELAGMVTGMTAGLVIARGVARAKPALPRAAVVVVATAIIAVASFAAVEGVIDARPELYRTVATEERIATEYTKAVNDFTRGRVTAKALAQVIERTILPPLNAERTRIASLRGVSREQAPLVAAAMQYFKLRAESWRCRAEGLRNENSQLLRAAERSERVALEALHRARP